MKAEEGREKEEEEGEWKVGARFPTNMSQSQHRGRRSQARGATREAGTKPLESQAI